MRATLMGLMTTGGLALGLLAATPAFARPPTVTISPGYDRALAESRRARETPPPVVVQPMQPDKPKPVRRHRR